MAAVAALVLYTTSVKADTVFRENFDTGSATFTVNDPYWTNQSLANGYIIDRTEPNTFSVLPAFRSTPALPTPLPPVLVPTPDGLNYPA